MAQIDDRVDELERRLNNLTQWVVYWDGEKYRHCNLGYAKKYSINYEPTKYDCAFDAREAAMQMNQ